MKKMVSRYFSCVIIMFVLLFLFEHVGYTEEEGKLRLAVIGFKTTGKNVDFPDLDKIVHEWLITFLVETEVFEVVERQELEKILQEQSLGQTGILNPESAAQVGQLLGVNILITGALIYFEDTLEVNARLIDSTNGAIVGVASVSTDDEEEFRPKIKELAGIIRRKLSKPPNIEDVKVYETFDGEQLNRDLWDLGFDDNFKKADKKKTTFVLKDGVLSITGAYRNAAESRVAWLTPLSGETYHSIEAKIRVREVEGGVSVCLGAYWNDENWAAICTYLEGDYGDVDVSLEDPEEQKATFEFDVRVNHWYILRLDYQDDQFLYYWDGKLIKRITPVTPVRALEDPGFDIGFGMEETRSVVIEIDEVLLR